MIRRRPLSRHELITILNRCHRFRGFAYEHAHFSADEKSIEGAFATIARKSHHMSEQMNGDPT